MMTIDGTVERCPRCNAKGWFIKQGKEGEPAFYYLCDCGWFWPADERVQRELSAILPKLVRAKLLPGRDGLSEDDHSS